MQASREAEQDTVEMMRDIGALRAMLAGPGWLALMKAAAVERERLIEKGKKARLDEPARCAWARLGGFDDAMSLASRLVMEHDDTPGEPISPLDD